jgi:subtilisin family serine protease
MSDIEPRPHDSTPSDAVEYAPARHPELEDPRPERRRAAAPRFRRDAGEPGPVQPGVVEVEFEPGARRTLLPPPDGGEAAEPHGATPALSPLGELLQAHNLRSAEPSIAIVAGDEGAGDGFAGGPGEGPGPQDFVTLRFPEDADTHRIAAEISAQPGVRRAIPLPGYLPAATVVAPRAGGGGPDPLAEPLVGISDLLGATEHQWYIHRCRVDEAWALASGKGVVVAAIDWGILLSHQEMAGRVDASHAYNAVDGSQQVNAGGNVDHGTGVAALAVASVNGSGMVGVAHQATLWPIQANTGFGPPLPGNPWANAIEWVLKEPAGGARKVILLETQTTTFGNVEMIPSVNFAIRHAISLNAVVCVPAGNGPRDAGFDDQGYPIPPTGSIVVGATAYAPQGNPRASESNYGSRVAIWAPGDSQHDLTASDSSNTAYRTDFGGTSGAVPKVAGTVALMLEVDPALTPAQVHDRLRATAADGTADGIGPFLDAYAAVAACLPPPSPPFPADPDDGADTDDPIAP